MPEKTAAEMLPSGVVYYPGGRTEYRQKTGRQAPPCIPGSLKMWESISPIGAYSMLGRDATGNPSALILCPANDGPVNMPGPFEWLNFAAWKASKPTSGVHVQVLGTDRLVDKTSLFTKAEATALAREIGNGAMAQEANDYKGVEAVYTYPEGEARRVCNIVVGGVAYIMSEIWQQRLDGHAEQTGIDPDLTMMSAILGSPGSWQYDKDAQELRWQPGFVYVGDGVTTYVPLPCRTLFDTEEAAFSGSLMSDVVVRLKGEAQQSSPSSTGGFTEADRAVQASILKKLKEISAMMSLNQV